MTDCCFLKLCKLKTQQVLQGNNFRRIPFNLFQSSVAFYIETSYLIYTANQMIGLKWVNELFYLHERFNTKLS